MKNVNYKEWFKSAMILVAVITATEMIYFVVYGVFYVVCSLCTKGREETISDIKNVWDKTKRFMTKSLNKIRGIIKPSKKPVNSGLKEVMREMARSGNYHSVSLDDLERSFESRPINVDDVPEDIRRRAE